MSETTDALETLLKSPGWRLFLEHAKEEWAPGACWRKAKEASALEKDLAKTMRRVDYTNEQVGKLLTWPSEEVKRLKRQEHEPAVVQGRGGYHR